MVGAFSEHSLTRKGSATMIHQLHSSELENAVRLVADSYADDPSVRAIIPYESTSQTLHALEVYVRYLLMEGMRCGFVSVLKIKNKLAGVVIYFPPGQPKNSHRSWFNAIRTAVTLIPLLGMGGFRRLIRLTKAIDGKRPNIPHYYIELGCVARRLKHKGVGTILANHIFRLANRDHCGVYAETFNPDNLAIMKRLGYKIQSKNEAHGLPFWSLWHEQNDGSRGAVPSS